MNYLKLTELQDPDIPYILSQYRLPEHVAFYKVYLGDELAATTHLEWSGTTLYMDIVVFPDHQRKGIGTAVISDIQAGVLAKGAGRIEIPIDEANIPSRKLFEKMGFVQVSQDDELIDYLYVFEKR